jgi:hypothetical protein
MEMTRRADLMTASTGTLAMIRNPIELMWGRRGRCARCAIAGSALLALAPAGSAVGRVVAPALAPLERSCSETCAPTPTTESPRPLALTARKPGPRLPSLGLRSVLSEALVSVLTGRIEVPAAGSREIRAAVGSERFSESRRGRRP